MNLHLLYIDPGTGSMLFSILIGSAATLYFLFRALIIKFKLFTSGGRRSGTSSRHPFIIYNEGKQYCNVFKPVLDEFEKRKTELVYLTSFQDDPVFSSAYQYIKSEFIGEGNKAFMRLNFISADVALMTTPGLQVYQLKRSRSVKHYAHVLHAPSDATMYRLFGIDYFDSILLTGDYQAKDIRGLEKIRQLPEKQLVTVGCTYLDVSAEKIKNIKTEENHQFTVLVSPSWGPSALLSRFGEKLLDPLVKTGWRIIVRPHPQSRISEPAILDNLARRYNGNTGLEWDFNQENISSLSKADIMISDFSGIIFDYAFLFDRPVIYVQEHFDLRPYDADDLSDDDKKNIWQFATVREIGIELKEELFERIDEVIKNAACSTELREARQKAKTAAWQFQGEAGGRIADFMISLRARDASSS